jgi:hypothetical protein
MDEKGLIVIWLEKFFGRSWHTWLAAITAAIPQIIEAFQTSGVNIGIPTSTLNSITAIALIVGVALSKSQTVSGANRTETTGVPGLIDSGKDPECSDKGVIK